MCGQFGGEASRGNSGWEGWPPWNPKGRSGFSDQGRSRSCPLPEAIDDQHARRADCAGSVTHGGQPASALHPSVESGERPKFGIRAPANRRQGRRARKNHLGPAARHRPAGEVDGTGVGAGSGGVRGVDLADPAVSIEGPRSASISGEEPRTV